MKLERLNASYMVVSTEISQRSEWEPLLHALEGALLALPRNINPPERLGCPRHPHFDPTCNFCWVSFRPYNIYRLYRLWVEGKSLVFRIPIGGVMLILIKYKDKLPTSVFQQIRNFLIQSYPPADTLQFKPEEFPSALYPYQLEAVQKSIKYRRCIISSPPGSGKTEIGSALIASAPKDWTIGWFTHTRSLLRQSQERLRKNLREDIGAISGEDDFSPRRVTVAMVQTITIRGQEKNDPNIIDWLRSLRLIVLDECHHAPAQTFYWTIMTCTNAWVRFGLTATPMREESAEELYIWSAFSPLIVEITPERLVSAGRLVPIYLVIYDLEPKPITRTYANWQEEYMEHIVRNKIRNYIIAAESILYRPTVILVWSLEHMNLIAQAINDLSKRFEIPVRVAVMHGGTPSRERMGILYQFERGLLDILIISDVGKEGLNIINMRTLVVAAGQKSKVAAIQRVGRGLRPKKWGYVRVVDFYDPSETTRRHSFRRIRTYQQQLPIIKIERKRAEEGIEELVRLLQAQKRTHSLFLET